MKVSIKVKDIPMKIKVKYEEEDLILKFMPYFGNTKRMWIQTTDFWYPSIGWCPHVNLGAGECVDCGLVLEND